MWAHRPSRESDGRAAGPKTWPRLVSHTVGGTQTPLSRPGVWLLGVGAHPSRESLLRPKLRSLCRLLVGKASTGSSSGSREGRAAAWGQRTVPLSAPTDPQLAQGRRTTTAKCYSSALRLKLAKVQPATLAAPDWSCGSRQRCSLAATQEMTEAANPASSVAKEVPWNSGHRPEVHSISSPNEPGMSELSGHSGGRVGFAHWIRKVG